MNKYKYIKVIQSNHGYGWDDECEYSKEEFGQVRADLKEYRLSCGVTGGSVMVVDRRVLNK